MQQGKMKKLIVIVLLASAIVSVLTFALINRPVTDLHVITKRELRIDHDRLTALFIVRGYYNSLLTTEGPYPDWSDSVLVSFRDSEKLKEFSNAKNDLIYSYPQDYSSLVGEVRSSSIRIISSNHTAFLDAKYKEVDSYKARLNGTYIIP
jgi:hypothetical protein